MATEPLAFPPFPDDPWGETPLSELDVVTFDTETGGLDPFKDPLLTVGLATHHGPIGEWTLKHEHYVPTEKILGINRITTDRARNGSPWLLIEELLTEQLQGRVVVGHNVGFDLCYLCANSPGMALPPAIDTAACCRHLWPGEKADLASLCARGRIDPGQAHGAGADAVAAAKGWIFLRAVLSSRGVDTWNKLCGTQATIPPTFSRPAWPDQVAAAYERAQREGARWIHGDQAAG